MKTLITIAAILVATSAAAQTYTIDPKVAEIVQCTFDNLPSGIGRESDEVYQYVKTEMIASLLMTEESYNVFAEIVANPTDFLQETDNELTDETVSLINCLKNYNN